MTHLTYAPTAPHSIPDSCQVILTSGINTQEQAFTRYRVVDEYQRQYAEFLRWNHGDHMVFIEESPFAHDPQHPQGLFQWLRQHGIISAPVTAREAGLTSLPEDLVERWALPQKRGPRHHFWISYLLM